LLTNTTISFGQNAPTSVLASLQRILQKILTRVGAWNIVRLFSLPRFNLGVLHSTRLATLFPPS
jgi:hypothetical protein